MVCHSTKVEVVEGFQIQIQLFIAKCISVVVLICNLRGIAISRACILIIK